MTPDVTWVTGGAIEADGTVRTPLDGEPPWLATIVWSVRGASSGGLGPLHTDPGCYGLNKSQSSRPMVIWAAYHDTEFCSFCATSVDYEHRFGDAAPTDGVADD